MAAMSMAMVCLMWPWLVWRGYVRLGHGWPRVGGFHTRFSLSFDFSHDTVQHRLSGPHLSRPSIIRTRKRQEIHYHACTEDVANDLFGYGHRLRDELRACFGQSSLIGLLFWTLLAMIVILLGIVYRIGIINRVRNVGTSRHFNYLDTSLICYDSDQSMDKGVLIIKVALAGEQLG